MNNHLSSRAGKNRDSILVDLGNQIRAERKRRGMSQADLANRIGGKVCTIGRLERGDGVKTDTLARVLGELTLSISLAPQNMPPETAVAIREHALAIVHLLEFR